MIRTGPRLLVLAALLAGTACGAAADRPFSGEGLAGPLIVPPLPKPDLVMRTTEGQPFDLKRDTEGYVTLLFFGYTHCPDLCPVQLANIATAMHRLPDPVTARIRVVFVTVDPARDTPAVTRAWLDHFDKRFIGLTGDSASVAYAITQLRLGQPHEPVPVDSAGYTINHTVVVLAFTTDNLAHVAYPSGIRADAWANDLTRLTGSR